MLFIGCSVSDIDDPDSSIVLSAEEIIFNSGEEARRQITVTSNGNWNSFVAPASAGSWLSASPASGSAGTTTVTISVSANGSGNGRSAEVVFTMSDGTSDRIDVEQPQTAVPFIDVDDNNRTIGWMGGDIEVQVLYNTGSYSVSIVPASAGSWITETDRTGSPGSDRLTFTISPRDIAAGREALIVFSSPDGSLTETVRLVQSGRPTQSNYSDGDYLLLQRATIGSGVNLIIMGDGYTENEINALQIYERDMRDAMEDFFSVYPYDAYRAYFNVWMAVGVSRQSGPSLENTMRDTRFGTWITGDGTEILLRNENAVTDLVLSIPGMPRDEGVLTVLMILNSPVYAGTSLMYSSGYSISMCPRIESNSPNTNARAVVMHECGGHGFGQLADEYAYGGTVPASEQAAIRQWQTSYGAFMNVDFTSDRNEVLWRDFFGYPKYTTNFVGFPIGVHEGALTYTFGVYRPEQNSCMNNNIDYFNAPSRYEIVRRIMSISGVDANLTVGEFVFMDNPRAPSFSRSAAPIFDGNRGFSSPVLRD